MMIVRHETIAPFDRGCLVKQTVLKQELIEEGMDPYSRELEQTVSTKLRAWKKLGVGRTWTAACKDDWNRWPMTSIRLWHDLYDLMRGSHMLVARNRRIDHIVDLSTLTLLRD